MICEGSASNSDPSNLLAPGFRFHPTDEELVIYYLKRKVSGLPLRVDAIAEIDLYKWEPWDLPSLSRLRSRDMEWYFFSPLDRKYSNRSRTNRATVEGYWKTTGKDRPVRHASKVVGMKKTLVFHAGRAPKGQRTNWVMHEYRLDSGAAGAGADSSSDHALSLPPPQDSFVVCRIFQKSGTGPQNGAQYGAPFMEEEWMQAEDFAPKTEGAFNGFMYASGEQDYVHSNDLQTNQVLGDPQESTTPVVAESEGQQDGGSNADDETTLLKDVFDLDSYINAPALRDGSHIANNMGEQFTIPSDQNDGYLELKDIFDNANEVQNYHIIANAANEFEGCELFDDANGTAQGLSQMLPLAADGIFNMQPDDFLNPEAGDYPSCQPTEDDIMFYDAPPSSDPVYTGDIFVNANDFPFSPAADLSGGFDVVDDLMAYFDATDNDLQYDNIVSFEEPEFVNSATMTQCNSEVEGKAALEVPEANTERGASSSARSKGANNLLDNMKENNMTAADMQANDGWNRALRKRVVDMLGSISAPPAMAEGSASIKGKAVGLLSAAARSSSSIHVSAGMIQIHDVTVMGSTEKWTLQKNGELSFVLSYNIGGKSVCFDSPDAELQSGVMSMLLRGGLYLFGLSVLFLSVSFKVGMCIYSK